MSLYICQMNKCLNCGKELEMTEGRRPKKFCNSSCRATYHQKKSGGKVRWVEIEKYEKLKKELEAERANRENPLINAARGRDENGVNNDENRDETNIHPLWQTGDPKENTMAFFMKRGAMNYEELQKQQKQ